MIVCFLFHFILSLKEFVCVLYIYSFYLKLFSCIWGLFTVVLTYKCLIWSKVWGKNVFYQITVIFLNIYKK